MMTNIALPIFAYLCGSVAAAVVVCRLLGYEDPRTAGSQNPGATNVLRLYGKQAAALTLAGDVLKGVVPVLIAHWFSDDMVLITITGLMAFIGHLFPVFFAFKGGKGVATYIGVLLAADWRLGLGFVGIWLVTAALFRYSSLAALLASLSIPLLSYGVYQSLPVSLIHTLMTLTLFWRHRSNIGNLINGTESRIGQKKTE